MTLVIMYLYKKTRASYRMTSLHSLEKNNFDITRITLALIVVFVHIATLTKNTNLINLTQSLYLDSDFAVKGFFAISGFLVMQSYVRSRSLLDFAEKRIRRIYPAYLGVIFFCLLLGALTSELRIIDFVQSSQTWKYLISNLLFLNFLQHTLPGTFEHNSISSMNGSLWTIKIEVALYCFVPMIYFLFNKLGKTLSTLALIAASIFWVYFFLNIYDGRHAEEISRQFPGQLSYFVLGAYFSQNKAMLDRIGLITILSYLFFVFTRNTAISTASMPLFYSSIVIYLSTSFIKNLNIGKYGDLSYGIYLYHFPIIQVLIWTGLYESYPLLSFALTLCLTIIIAWLSWHFIEKKLLKRSSHYIANCS